MSLLWRLRRLRFCAVDVLGDWATATMCEAINTSAARLAPAQAHRSLGLQAAVAGHGNPPAAISARTGDRRKLSCRKRQKAPRRWCAPGLSSVSSALVSPNAPRCLARRQPSGFRRRGDAVRRGRPAAAESQRREAWVGDGFPGYARCPRGGAGAGGRTCKKPRRSGAGWLNVLARLSDAPAHGLMASLSVSGLTAWPSPPAPGAAPGTRGTGRSSPPPRWPAGRGSRRPGTAPAAGTPG